MAYLDATFLLDYQSSGAYNEKRKYQHGLVDAATDSTSAVSFIPQDIIEGFATANSTRNLRIPYLKDGQVTVTQTPGFNNIPLNLGETGEFFVSAYDIWSGMVMYNSTFANNTVRREWYAKEQLSNILMDMADTKETIIANVLEAQKTQKLDYTAQVSETALDYNFNTGTDVLEIKKAAQNDTMFYNLQKLMQANKLGGKYKLVHSPAGLTITSAEAMKYGVGNSKNIEWAQSYLSESDIYESHNISATERWDGYLIKNGSIGLYNNYPYDFREGTIIDSHKWEVSPIEMPFIRSRPNIYMSERPADSTGLVAGSDNIMGTRQEMAIWDRVYVVYPINSDIANRANPIVKINALNS